MEPEIDCEIFHTNKESDFSNFALNSFCKLERRNFEGIREFPNRDQYFNK